MAIASTTRDAETAALIATALTLVGFDVVATSDRPDTMVVLLSNESVNDPDFLETHVVEAAAEPVPVALEDVGGSRLPPAVARLNWIWWDREQPESAAVKVSSALLTNQRTYAGSRILEAKAWAWQAAGRGTDELLTSTRQVAAAAAWQVAESGRQVGATPIDDFLRDSRAHARRLRTRRILSGCVFLVAASLVVVAAFALVDQLRTLTERSQLASVANADVPLATADVNAIKIAAFIALSEDQGTNLTGTPVAANLAGLLSEPWPVARLSAPKSTAVNGFAAFDGETRAWLARGDGKIQEVTVGGDPTGREMSAEGALYDLAASADGSVVLATGTNAARLMRAGGMVGMISLPQTPDDVAVRADGRFGAVAWGGHVEVLDLRSGAPSALRTSDWDDVLDVEAGTDGIMIGLVREDKAVAVVDLLTGARLWRSRTIADPFVAGALGQDGSVVIHADRRLWWSSGGSALKPTGVTTSDAVTALDTEDGLVAVASGANGSRLHDMRLGVPLPEICRGLAHVRRVIILSRSDAVVCDGWGLFETWAVDRPAAPQAASELADAGVATVSIPRLPENVVLRGEIAAVATTGGTAAVGTTAGEVVEFDVPASGPGLLTGRWTMPDEAAVRALAYSGTDSLTVGTDTATWTVRPCPGCGVEIDRQIAAVVGRPKRCFSTELTEIVPQRVIEALRVTLCEDTV